MTDLVATEADAQHGAGCVVNARPVHLRGDIDAGTDLSGVAVVGDYLVLGADEGHQLQTLARCADDDCWRLEHRTALAKQDQETDIEAITFGDGHLYVIGSHSFVRRHLRPELSVRKNRERLLDIRQEAPRNRLYRLAFDGEQGRVGSSEWIDLSKRLRKDPLLGTFYGLPSKENGVDIEGIVYRDGLLYLGFRGPVLRGNYVPVMQLDFEQPKAYALRFVCLDGQGIRDMVALERGFLVLSGPVNDAPGPFCLWWWDGHDQIMGRDRKGQPAVMLASVTSPGGAKAEGLALLGQAECRVEVLVVYETDTASQMTAITLELPR